MIHLLPASIHCYWRNGTERQKNKLSLLFFAIFLSVPFFSIAREHSDTFRTNEIGLKTAIETGWITATITGAESPELYTESVDQEGLHYGKCMAISIINNTDTNIAVRMNCGTLMIPDDKEIQVMVATHDVTFEIGKGVKYTTKFYAMCTQMHLLAPTSDDNFTVGGDADTTMLKLINYIANTYNQNILGQHAVWAYTDHAAVGELENFGADKNSIEKTIGILNGASISTNLNYAPPVRISPKPEKNYVPYLVAGLFSLVGCGSVVYFLRYSKLFPSRVA